MEQVRLGAQRVTDAHDLVHLLQVALGHGHLEQDGLRRALKRNARGAQRFVVHRQVHVLAVLLGVDEHQLGQLAASGDTRALHLVGVP